MIQTRSVLAVAVAALAWMAAPRAALAQAAPAKRILLVTTTVGFRHASVPLLERVLRQMAKDTGQFTIVSTTDSPDYPEAEYFRTVAERNAAHGATPNNLPPINNNFFGPVATPAQYAALDRMNKAIAGPERAAAEAARQLTQAMEGPGDAAGVAASIATAGQAQAAAELQLAQARTQAVQAMQASPGRLDAAQLASLEQMASQAPGGGIADFEDGGVTVTPLLSGGGRGGFGGGRGGRGAGAAGLALPAAQERALTAAATSVRAGEQAVTAARAALAKAEFDPAATMAGLRPKVEALQAAERALTEAQTTALAPFTTAPERRAAAQVLASAGARGGRGGFGRGGFGAGANPINADVAKVLQQYLNPQALRNYDAVIFVSTTGELPIPDKAAFFQWIREGHGFIGIHSAADTLHQTPDYIQMLGGEFATHGTFHPAMPIENMDPASPITAGWGSSRTVNEEYYLFKNFDPAKVHLLLALRHQPYTKAPGLYPVSWIKMYGKGRVFYTSLGHRDDVILPHAVIGDEEFKVRYNQPPVAEAFQHELLQGIRWATGLIQADATPGNVK